MDRVLVVGLGNPVLGDDGVGPAVIRELAAGGIPEGAALCEAAVGGLRLLELLEGFDHAVLIDACECAEAPGTIRTLPLEAAALALPGACGHGIRLEEALALGRALGVQLPAHVMCVSIAVADTRTFREALSPEVARAVPEAARQVTRQVAAWLSGEALSTKPVSQPR